MAAREALKDNPPDPDQTEHQWDAEDGDVSGIEVGFAVADRGELLRQRRPRVSK